MLPLASAQNTTEHGEAGCDGLQEKWARRFGLTSPSFWARRSNGLDHFRGKQEVGDLFLFKFIAFRGCSKVP